MELKDSPNPVRMNAYASFATLTSEDGKEFFLVSYRFRIQTDEFLLYTYLNF